MSQASEWKINWCTALESPNSKIAMRSFWFRFPLPQIPVRYDASGFEGVKI